MNTIKQVVESLVAAGTPLSDIIRQVNVAAVEKALVMHYGNQTKAAEQLGCHRSIIRKYALVRVKNCTEADEEGGFVVRFKLDENDMLTVNGAEIETETLYVNVQIIDPLEKKS